MGNQIKSKDFHVRISQQSGLDQKQAEAAVKAMANVIREELVQGNTIRITGLGTMSARLRPARKGYNPTTREALTIPARIAPHMSWSETIKKAMPTP